MQESPDSVHAVVDIAHAYIPTNSLSFIMQETGAKRPAKLPQRESTEENDRSDTLSDACQVANTDGDVRVTQSTLTNLAHALRQCVVVCCTRFLWFYPRYQHIFFGSVRAPPLRMGGWYPCLPIQF